MSYTWHNAEFLCESLGSSLASAHNIWEYSFLQQLAWRAGYLTAWLGGHKFQGYWRWEDGTPFDYNNWYSTSYDCVHLNSQEYRGWSGGNCATAHPFICSYKLGHCASASV
ncbi:ladderlectin-like [Symphorus nematophorus]